jgi:hypothetical protein
MNYCPHCGGKLNLEQPKSKTEDLLTELIDDPEIRKLIAEKLLS